MKGTNDYKGIPGNKMMNLSGSREKMKGFGFRKMVG